MAVSQRPQSESDDDSRTIDLKDDLGLDLPPTEVSVEVVPRGGSRTLYVTRTHKWTVEGAGSAAEVTAVYDDGASVTLPERVPQWLRLVCREYGVDELAI